MTQEHTGDNKPVTQASQAPTALTGALVGGLLTLPLIIVFQLSANLLGTAFVPIDGFDWLIRNLPGGLLTFGVDTMVDFLIASAWALTSIRRQKPSSNSWAWACSC
jgi:cell division protein FtsX